MDYSKRRKPSYLTSNPVEGQTFTNLKPVYKLNNATGELETTGEFIDIDELVDSFKDIALDNILERFIPLVDQQKSDQIVEYQQMTDDVDFMREMSERAESYRQKYQLSDDLSIKAIFDEVQKRSEDLKVEIDKKQAFIKKAEDLKKQKAEEQKDEEVQEDQ